MHIYLHETIDPVRAPGAAQRYLDEIGRVVASPEGNAEGSAGGRCIANWVPLFLTGTWPQIIGFWQMPGGWDGFAEHFDTHPELFHQPLDRWYGERSGGFDRVLIGTDWTPTLDDIVADGLRAPVVLHETVRVAPGGAGRYLDLLGEFREKHLGGRTGGRTGGHTGEQTGGRTGGSSGEGPGFGVLGGYEVAFRNGGEVVVVWSFPDVRTLTRTQSTPEEFPELLAWRARSAALETSHTGVVVRPTEWSPLR